MILDRKFIVFSRDEWDRVWEHAEPPGGLHPIADATVIRSHDRFAAGVLFGYANNIQTVLDTIDTKNAPPEVIQGMFDALEYIGERAREAEDIRASHHATLPD